MSLHGPLHRIMPVRIYPPETSRAWQGRIAEQRPLCLYSGWVSVIPSMLSRPGSFLKESGKASAGDPYRGYDVLLVC